MVTTCFTDNDNYGITDDVKGEASHPLERCQNRNEVGERVVKTHLRNRKHLMIKILILILIGVVIGWSIPKPAIVDTVITKVKEIINSIIGKFKRK